MVKVEPPETSGAEVQGRAPERARVHALMRSEPLILKSNQH